MSLSSLDIGAGGGYETNNLVLWSSLGMLLFVSLLTMKTVFGSYNPRTIVLQQKQRREFSQEYHRKFESRDTLLYHISWAKSRGELKEAKKMMKELRQLDKEIDELEAKTSTVFGKSGKLTGEKAL